MCADAFWQTVLNRRSIRRYTTRPVPEAVLRRCLQAAVWAPSAHNRQPWRFVVVRQAARRHLLAQRMAARWEADLLADGVTAPEARRRAERSQRRIEEAAVIVVGCLSMRDMDVYGDARRQKLEWQMAVQSTALALGQFLLALHHEGLGACWMCAPLFVPDLVREVLDLPADWQPQALITVGYPAEERTSERKELEEVVLWR